MSKTIILKDEKELIETTKKLLEKMRVDPNSMPVCILCGTNRSSILLAYSPEWEYRTALFGVCDACNPSTEKELVDKVVGKVKEKMVTQENTIHLKRKELMQ